MVNLKKKTKKETNKARRGFNKLLFLFPAMYVFLIVSYFGMENQTISERYTVKSTSVNANGLYITLSDNTEYLNEDSTLDGLKAGDEVILTTVEYQRKIPAKTLINNEKVYSSMESRNAESFRTALKYVWVVLDIILALITVTVIFDLMSVVIYGYGTGM